MESRISTFPDADTSRNSDMKYAATAEAAGSGAIHVRDILPRGKETLLQGTANVSPLLPPPPKMFGFTYVSVFIEKFSLPSEGREAGITMQKPLMTISVYSSKGQPIEVAQVKH